MRVSLKTYLIILYKVLYNIVQYEHSTQTRICSNIGWSETVLTIHHVWSWKCCCFCQASERKFLALFVVNQSCLFIETVRNWLKILGHHRDPKGWGIRKKRSEMHQKAGWGSSFPPNKCETTLILPAGTSTFWLCRKGLKDLKELHLKNGKAVISEVLNVLIPAPPLVVCAWWCNPSASNGSLIIWLMVSFMCDPGHEWYWLQVIPANPTGNNTFQPGKTLLGVCLVAMR